MMTKGDPNGQISIFTDVPFSTAMLMTSLVNKSKFILVKVPVATQTYNLPS